MEPLQQSATASRFRIAWLSLAVSGDVISQGRRVQEQIARPMRR
jgi:hypothetical protein